MDCFIVFCFVFFCFFCILFFFCKLFFFCVVVLFASHCHSAMFSSFVSLMIRWFMLVCFVFCLFRFDFRVVLLFIALLMWKNSKFSKNDNHKNSFYFVLVFDCLTIRTMIKLCFVYCVMILSRISMFVVSYDCCFARSVGFLGGFFFFFGVIFFVAVCGRAMNDVIFRCCLCRDQAVCVLWCSRKAVALTMWVTCVALFSFSRAKVWHFCFLFCFCVWCVVVRRAVCVYVRTPLKHGCDVTCSMTDVRYVRFVWRV